MEIAKNLTTDSSYQTTELRNMVNTVLTNDTGNISYHFNDTTRSEQIQVNAVWNTVLLGCGKEWRFVLTDNVPESVDISGTNTTVEELKRFVEKAYVYTNKVGKEKALAEFNNPNGKFIDGEPVYFCL